MVRPFVFALTAARSLVAAIAVCLAPVPETAAQAPEPPPLELMADGREGEATGQWFVPVEGWEAKWIKEEGDLVVRLRKTGESRAPFGNTMSVIDAEPFRGRMVRLTGRIRVEGDKGRAQMWLRVDRPDQQMGAFDNMGDRPIMPGQWVDATIELEVAPDARQLGIGVMSMGGASVLIDSVRLTMGEAVVHQQPSNPAPLSARGVENLEAATRLLSYVRFFHPSDQAAAVEAWDQFAVQVMEAAEPATDATDLATRLSDAFAPIAPSLLVYVGDPERAPGIAGLPPGTTQLLHWRHNGAGRIGTKGARNIYSSEIVREEARSLDERALGGWMMAKSLGGGVSCVLPVGVAGDGGGTLPHVPVETPWSSIEGQARLTAMNRSTRLAGVAILWGVMEHFYPYFDVVGTDWNEALGAALADAADDADEDAYERTLRRLVAKLHDGHGGVRGPGRMEASMLPLAFAWAGDDLVVSGKDTGAPTEISIGDVAVSMDGRSVQTWCAEAGEEISAATEGWLRSRLLTDLAMVVATSDPCPMRLRRADGVEYDVQVPRVVPAMIEGEAFKRPVNGAEVAPGIVYFDLNGAETDALDAAMPALENARGIVFDMRGYPGSAAYQLMQRLIDTNATSARWNIPIVTRPDREGWEWNEGGRWQLRPAKPRLQAQIAFLTDGRAISYAESIMGIVEAYGLGEIVGATTAGTNGNVNPFELPGGYAVSWTGMKVLKHDGSQHHGVGIAPTVPVEPTAAGIAAGRDEVLAKGVEVLQERIASVPERAP